MSKAAIAGLMNAEMVLKTHEKGLERQIQKTQAQQRKAKKQLLDLMKKGDEETINGQAELVASLDSSIKSMSRSKQKLSIFATKVSMARQKQSIGAGMLAVSKALGRVTDSIQLERVEQVMDSLEKQYEDIDVMTAVLDDSTSKSTARDVPLEEVERVKRMVADEAGLELSQELNAASAVREEPKKVGPTEEEEDRIRERLRALRERQVAS